LSIDEFVEIETLAFGKSRGYTAGHFEGRTFVANDAFVEL
jgi:hypothetical protein